MRSLTASVAINCNRRPRRPMPRFSSTQRRINSRIILGGFISFMSKGKQATKVETYQNFIAGEWASSRTGQTFENINPADTRDCVGRFQDSNAEDVETAVAASKAAYNRWRLV